MSKSPAHPDVLVLGEHPCAYLAAASLRLGSAKLRVVHATIPGERSVDRLVIINPEFFDLHKSLAGVQKKLDLTPVYGLRFLSNDAKTSSEYRHKSILAYVGSFHDVRDAMLALAEEAGVEFVQPKSLEVQSLDEHGIDLSTDKATLRAKALILAGFLSEAQHKKLGLPDSWGEGVVHRYSFVRLPALRTTDTDPKPIVPMSLDLNGELCWGWLLSCGDEFQLAVSQPIETAAGHSPVGLLELWASALHRHGVLKDPLKIAPNSVQTMDLPLGGALAHEGVANRTLLIGPAGGFFSATAEDIYPTCWSAIYAADVLRKALKEPHLQDAINSYRQVWRTTLGDYMRGPQQNLRFLLPLVYRNQVMTARLTESILQGKSVVR